MFEERERVSLPPTHAGAVAPHAPALVVGVGAAAGGFDALRELFSALDEGAGMAFIVVMHGAPDNAVERLSAVTSLPVSMIAGGIQLVPDHIFVAPLGVDVHLNALSFELSEPTQETANPIDVLFRSLSQAFGPHAVGVILSGAGSDGAIGMQSISNLGGMTAAQAPAEAEFDSMPRGAIATGVVDHVLGVRDIAEELLAYVGHVQQQSEDSSGFPDADAIATALPEICDLLNAATDHNFKHYKTSTLMRRIQRRIQVLHITAVDAYLKLLREDSDELRQLFRELLIGVTAFFRDPEAFESLQQRVLRPMLQARAHQQLRIWVPGCATGEEAYTLAMLVREAMSDIEHPPEVQLFATDIDERALSTARRGVYPAGIAEDVSPERLERFFIKRGKRFQVTKEISALCLFSPHNLINDPPFSRIDLISCRNLLIYFGPHLQQKLIPLFHFALRRNGCLFLGPSENLSSHKELFTPIDAKHRISQRRSTGIRSSPMVPPTSKFRAGGRPSEHAAEPQPDLHQIMQRMLLDEFAPKSVIVTEEGRIVCASGDMQRYLTVTEGTFQNNVVRLTRPGLRVGLRAALTDAIKIRRRVVHDKLSVQVDGGLQRVRLTVQPMPRLGEEAELFLVVFQDAGSLLPREELSTETAGSDADKVVEQLERELASTRDDLEKSIQDLEAVNEELKSSNEELLSMNEELQSTNEELETSKEEVQASNEALARAHANMSNLLTSTAIATIFLDEQDNILSYTPAVTAIYNLIPSDAGRPLAHVTHRAREMPPLPTTAELRAQGRPSEHDVVTPERWYLRRALPYRSHDGGTGGLVLTFLDVTELKSAEAAALRDQRRLQLITDAVPVLISYVDVHERYRFNNKAYQNWFDTTPESLLGKTVAEVLGAAAYAVIAPHIRRALAGNATSYDADLDLGRHGVRSIHADYVPDIGPDNEVRGYFSLKRDISEQRRVAQVLSESKRLAEEANRAKSDFLANMSHEIRTPISAILGYAELLLSHMSDPDNVACIDAIKRNGQHLVELINDILDLSKIEAGMMNAERIRFSPTDLMREVIEGMRLRASERGLALELKYDGALPATIESDPTRLRQILLNLVGNAIKFTQQGQIEVTVKLLVSERLLQVTVADTGIGIAPDRKAQLFEPFTQADTSVTRQYGGTGLGLTISRRLIELLGGRISVESEPGIGSTFTFTIATGALDRSRLATSPPPVQPSATLLPGTLRALRVLVVDDRRDMRYLLQSFLEEAGAEVATAADGQSAVEAIRASLMAAPLHAVVLDMQMPTMDGYEAARRMRALGYRGKIIALTASAMKGDRERCIEAGCDHYLTKPADRVQLLQLIAQPPSSTTPTAAKGTPANGSVLLVEDNPDSAEVMALLLQAAGLSVVTALDGAQALAQAASHHPRVVVLDLGLPDVDGYTVLARLKQMETLRATTFIALSGRSGPEERRRILDAGFHHQLVKPADHAVLTKLVRQGLDAVNTAQ